MSFLGYEADGPVESVQNALGFAQEAAQKGDISEALTLLETLALGSSPSSSAIAACGERLDDLIDQIATAEDLACYHRAKGYLALSRNDDELGAAHLSVSLRFASNEEASETLVRVREVNGDDFAITTYNDALSLLLTSGEKIGPTQRVVSGLEQELDEAVAKGDEATAQSVAKTLYDLTRDHRYLS